MTEPTAGNTRLLRREGSGCCTARARPRVVEGECIHADSLAKDQIRMELRRDFSTPCVSRGQRNFPAVNRFRLFLGYVDSSKSQRDERLSDAQTGAGLLSTV